MFLHKHLWDGFDGNAGDLSEWVGVSSLEEITLELYGLHASDSVIVWGTGEDAPSDTSNAVSLATLGGGSNYLQNISPFIGKVAIELDVKGGSVATRQARLMGRIAH